MKLFTALLLAAVTLLGVAAPASTYVATAQILDYEKGYLFFTTGDGFHVAPNVVIVGGEPAARRFARVTFDSSGVVTKIEVANSAFPPEGDPSRIHRFAVTISTPAPNPDLGAPPTTSCGRVIPGRRVTVTVNVEVPPTTGMTDQVYMTTDQSGWNPQAYKLDRVDALHYRAAFRFYSGTVLHYLFDRGSSQSIERGEDGLDVKPYLLCIGDADVQAVGKKIYHWGDEASSGVPAIPQTMPTPYNPAPFPNLPTPPPVPVHTSLPK
jgi:hypothetical protein